MNGSREFFGLASPGLQAPHLSVPSVAIFLRSQVRVADTGEKVAAILLGHKSIPSPPEPRESLWVVFLPCGLFSFCKVIFRETLRKDP